VLQSSDIPLHEPPGLLKDEAPSMAGWIQSMSSHVSNKKRSCFDNMPLFNIPRKAANKIPHNDKCI
jgi:hypothetical protein